MANAASRSSCLLQSDGRASGIAAEPFVRWLPAAESSGTMLRILRCMQSGAQTPTRGRAASVSDPGSIHAATAALVEYAIGSAPASLPPDVRQAARDIL